MAPCSGLLSLFRGGRSPVRQCTDERWINSLICCYRPQAQCTGEMSKRRKSVHENGEGRARASRKRGEREDKRPCWGRDKHGNKKKKRGDKSLLLFVHKQTRLFSGSFVSFHCKFLCFLFLLHGPELSACPPSLYPHIPPVHQFILFATFVSLALSTL